MFERLIQRLFRRNRQEREQKASIPGFENFHSQYPGSEHKNLRFVVIGLDFGTAFTKVVISDKSDSFAVRQRLDLNGIDAYLQPGLLVRNKDGEYDIASSQTHPRLFRNLKLALMMRPENPIARTNAAAFLALVLQRVRTQFMTQHRDIFGNNQLDWHLNIGLPAENYDNKILVDTFKSLAETAWTLSVLEGPLDQSKARFTYQAVSGPDGLRDEVFAAASDRLIHPDKVAVIPEVMAETVSYARSPLRSDGLHLLVDVGAGTLDVNAFVLLNREDEDRYALFLPKVYLLGSAYLGKHRNRELKRKGLLKEEKNIGLFSEYTAIPGREQLAKKLGLGVDAIKGIDREFLDRVGNGIYDVINTVRQEHGDTIHHWHEQLPTFLAGGGSTDVAYRERLKSLSAGMVKNGLGGLFQRPLPKPERLRMPGILDGNFHRLAVAFGLAHDPLDLGDFIPRKEIPPLEEREKRRHYEEAYVGPEHT